MNIAYLILACNELHDMTKPEEFYELDNGDQARLIMNDIPIIEQSIENAARDVNMN